MGPAAASSTPKGFVIMPTLLGLKSGTGVAGPYSATKPWLRPAVPLENSTRSEDRAVMGAGSAAPDHGPPPTPTHATLLLPLPKYVCAGHGVHGPAPSALYAPTGHATHEPEPCQSL
eukprot:2559172-Rhodomonas_salina.1